MADTTPEPIHPAEAGGEPHGTTARGVGSARRRRIDKLDALLLVLALALGAALGSWLVLGSPYVFFYQVMMPSSVVAACGLGFKEPAIVPSALTEFLSFGRMAFDCSLLQGVELLDGLGGMGRAHLYLLSSVAALWSVLGLSYVVLWPLVAGLHGLYAAGAFLLGRLFLPRWAAAVLALLLAVSPLATAVLASSLRDYAKGPFFVWAIVFLVLTIRARSATKGMALAAVLGGVVGLGIGFRSDTVAMLPFCLIGLLIGLWNGPVPLLGRLGAVVTFLVVTGGLMLPLQSAATSTAGVTGAPWMQGSTEPFRWHLRLPPTIYDLGERYSDELTYSTIGAELRRPDPAAFDSAEWRRDALSQAHRNSTGYVLGWANLFVADVATRALASAWLTAGLPTLLVLPQAPVVLYDVPYPGQFGLSRHLAGVWALLAQPWTPVLGILGLLSVLWRSFDRSRPEAAALTAVFVCLLGLPSLQFALRHLFHLEVLFWLGVLSLLTLPGLLPRLRSSASGFAAWCAGAALLTAGVYGVLILWQDRALKTEVATLLAAPGEVIEPKPVPRAEGRILLPIPPPPEAAGLFGGAPDALTLGHGRAALGAVRAVATRLIVQVNDECRTSDVDLEMVYSKLPVTWQPMDRSLSVHSQATIIVPAYYRPSQAFEGIEIDASKLHCIGQIRRVEPAGRLPVIFSAVLASGWQDRSMRLHIFGDRGPTPPR